MPGGRLVAIAARDKILTQGTGNPGPFLWHHKGHNGLAAVCFLLEAGKIMAAMQLAWWLTSAAEVALAAGVLAVVGHGYSPFLRFIPCRGGVVYLGFALGVSLWAGVGLAALWGAVYMYFNRQNMALFAVLLAMPAVLFYLEGTNPALSAIVLFAYGLWHHRWQFLTTRIFS